MALPGVEMSRRMESMRFRPASFSFTAKLYGTHHRKPHTKHPSNTAKQATGRRHHTMRSFPPRIHAHTHVSVCCMSAAERSPFTHWAEKRSPRGKVTAADTAVAHTSAHTRTERRIVDKARSDWGENLLWGLGQLEVAY